MAGFGAAIGWGVRRGIYSNEKNVSILSMFSPSSNSMIPYILSLSNRTNYYSHNINKD